MLALVFVNTYITLVTLKFLPNLPYSSSHSEEVFSNRESEAYDKQASHT